MKEKLDSDNRNLYKYRFPGRKQSDEEGDTVTHVVDISWSAIAKVLITIAAIYFATRIIQVVVIFFFAFVLMSSLMPLVNFLKSKKVPRLLSIFISYFLVALLLLLIGFTVARPVMSEFSTLVDRLPSAIESTIEKIGEFSQSAPLLSLNEETLERLFSEELLSQLFSSGVSGLDATILTISGFGNLISSFFLGLIISIYFMFDHDHYLDFLLERIHNEQKRVLVKELVDDVEKKLGNWLFAQGLLMFIIGLMTYVMLRLLSVEFALPLSIITGLFSIIPTLGPVIASVILIVFTLIFNGFNTALFVAIGSIVIQQIDNAFITPRLMSNVSGMSPVLVLLAVMVGFGIGGVIGAILAVPMLVIIKIGLDFYKKFPRGI